MQLAVRRWRRSQKSPALDGDAWGGSTRPCSLPAESRGRDRSRTEERPGRKGAGEGLCASGPADHVVERSGLQCRCTGAAQAAGGYQKMPAACPAALPDAG